jgi:hypothetical protein
MSDLMASRSVDAGMMFVHTLGCGTFDQCPQNCTTCWLPAMTILKRIRSQLRLLRALFDVLLQVVPTCRHNVCQRMSAGEDVWLPACDGVSSLRDDRTPRTVTDQIMTGRDAFHPMFN